MAIIPFARSMSEASKTARGMVEANSGTEMGGTMLVTLIRATRPDGVAVNTLSLRTSP